MKREPRSLARMHRRRALQIGEGKIALSVPAVSGAEQREEGGVLTDRHELPVAKRPTGGREVEREDSNFSHEWVRHGTPPNLRSCQVIVRELPSQRHRGTERNGSRGKTNDLFM